MNIKENVELLDKSLVIIDKNSGKTMSSREIAELMGKRHDHVLRDIDELNESYEKLGLPIFGETPYKNEQNGETYREFHLNYLQTMDLITGYSRELRIKVVHRWHELESRGSDLSSENELKKMLSSIISQYDKRLLALEQNQAHEQRIQALEKNQAHEQRIQILEKNQEHTVNPRVTSWEKTHYELTEEDIFNIY